MEGAISQGVWKFGLRQSRYVGLAKTHFQRIAMAKAKNIFSNARLSQGSYYTHTRYFPFMALASV